MKKSDRAWIAGFYEGEGSVWLAAGQKHVISVELPQKERFVLDQIKNLLGFGKVYGPYHQAKPYQNRVYYRLIISTTKPVFQFYQMIEDWLSPKRKRQFRAAFETLLQRKRFVAQHVHPNKQGCDYKQALANKRLAEVQACWKVIC
jgi:hypothetical protein